MASSSSVGLGLLALVMESFYCFLLSLVASQAARPLLLLVWVWSEHYVRVSVCL